MQDRNWHAMQQRIDFYLSAGAHNGRHFKDRFYFKDRLKALADPEADTTEDVVEGTQIPNDAPQRSAQFSIEQGDEELHITSEVLLAICVLSETPRPRNLTTTVVDPAHCNDEMAAEGGDLIRTSYEVLDLSKMPVL